MILQIMDVRGLSLPHIKSHLQMYRSTKHDEILQDAGETAKKTERMMANLGENYPSCNNHQSNGTGYLEGLAFKNHTLALPWEKKQGISGVGMSMISSSCILFNDLPKKRKTKETAMADVVKWKSSDSRHGESSESNPERNGEDESGSVLSSLLAL